MQSNLSRNTPAFKKLKRSFFERDDLIKIAKELIGKVLCTNIDGIMTGGVIVEAEAYRGGVDKASHAYPNKVTKRTEVMFKEGGLAYVYLCYGIHKLFNIVTNKEGKADAILVRAVEPEFGIESMAARRKLDISSPLLTSGPGKLTMALGIDLYHNGIQLDGNEIWIEDRGYKPEVTSGKRIGVEYAGKDANLPWRFYVRGNKWVSS